MKRTKSRAIIALLLVLTMLLPMLVADNRAKASAEPESVTMQFSSTDGSNFYFKNAQLADGSKLQAGYYKVEATIGTDTEVTKYVTIHVQDSLAPALWKDFFTWKPSGHTTTVPTKSFKIAKDAVWTEVVKDVWDVKENGKTYKMGKEFCIEKDAAGNWAEKKPEPESVTMQFKKVSGGAFNFAGQLADGSKLKAGFYKVQATIGTDKVVTKDVTIQVEGNGNLAIWDSFFTWTPSGHTTTIPTKSFKIAKDAVFTEVQIVNNVWSIVEDGTGYKVKEECCIEKDASDNWVQKQNAEANLQGVSLEFRKVSSDYFVYTGILTTSGEAMKAGYYRVEATIGTDTGEVTKEVVFAVGKDGEDKKIAIYPNYFNSKPGTNNTLPTKSLSFAKGAVFTEVTVNTWGDVAGGQKYQLSEDSKVIKSGSAWTAQAPTEDVTLEFRKESNNYFIYTGTVTKTGNAMKSGWYRVKGTVGTDTGDVETDIVFSVANDADDTTKVWIIDGFFSTTPGTNNVKPTKSLTFAKGTVFTEVAANTWGDVAGGQKYQLSESIRVVKEQSGTWSKQDGAGSELQGATMELGSTDGSNFYFRANTSEGGKLAAGYFKVEATIGRDTEVTKEITVQVENSGSISIWSTFFHWEPGAGSTVPTKSLKIAKDAVFTEVECPDNRNWNEKANGRSFKLDTELSIVNENGTWTQKTAGSTGGEGGSTGGEGGSTTPAGITLTFNKENIGHFVYVGTLADNTALPNGYYKMMATITTDTETVTKEVVFEVSDGGKMLIYPNFFSPHPGQNYSTPTKKLVFEKDAVLKQVAVNTWGEVSGGKQYILSERISIENNEGWRLEGTAAFDPDLPASMPSVKGAFNRADSKNNFCFDWQVTDGEKPASGWYRASIEVDGVMRSVIIEAGGKTFWIYYQNYTIPPNGANPKVPVDTVKIPAGTVIVPIVYGQFDTVRQDGIFYKVSEDISAEKQNGIWITAGLYDEEPLEVTVSFSQVYRGALYLKAVAADGTSIKDLYGEHWPLASGSAIRGISDDENHFTYTKNTTMYCLISNGLYLGELALNELDEVTIEAGTVLYPTSSAHSYRPVKIVNTFTMTRDAEDKWVSDNISASTSTGNGSTQTGNGSGSNGSGSSASPKNGDQSMQVFWLIMLSCAGVSIILLETYRRGRNQKR